MGRRQSTKIGYNQGRRSMVALILSGLLLSVALWASREVLAWDGNWTQGKSGVYLDSDSGSSEAKSGNKPEDVPQHYYIPPNRDFDDIDPGELADYRFDDYSPYALAR